MARASSRHRRRSCEAAHAPARDATTTYRVRRYRAVVRHLHLVDGAYACLTHLALKAPGAQGHRAKRNVLRLPPVSHRKTLMRQVLWQEALNEVARHTHDKRVLRRLEKLLAA